MAAARHQQAKTQLRLPSHFLITEPESGRSAAANEQAAPPAEVAPSSTSTDTPPETPGALTPFPLEVGSRQWQVQGLPTKSKETPRWPLAYAFGEFPYAVGSQISFRGKTYMLEAIHTSSLTVRAL